MLDYPPEKVTEWLSRAPVAPITNASKPQQSKRKRGSRKASWSNPATTKHGQRRTQSGETDPKRKRG